MSLFDDWNSSHDTGFTMPNESIYTPSPTSQFDSSHTNHVQPSEIEVNDAPKFNVAQVNWVPSPEVGTFVSLCAGNSMVLVGTTNNFIVRWNADNGELQETLLTNKKDEKICNTFIDPHGEHSLITMTNGNNYYYIPNNRTKPVLLTRFRGHVVTSASWYNYAKEPKVQRLLVGTNKCQLWEITFEDGKERTSKMVFDIRDGDMSGITGLHVSQINSAKLSISSGVSLVGTPYIVIVTTPTRLYQFFGYESIENVFRRYPNSPSFLELPGGNTYSCLVCYASPSDKLMFDHFYWLTSSSVYHGVIASSVDEREEGLLDCQLLDFPDIVDEERVRQMESEGDGYGSSPPLLMPISIAPTRNHIIVVYKQQVIVMNILSKEVIYQMEIPKTHGRAQHAVFDVSTGCYWIYTEKCLLEVEVSNENAGMWRVHLDHKDYDAAIEACGSEYERAIVQAERADHLFSQEYYQEAAQCYLHTRRSFESIVLKYLQAYNDIDNMVRSSVLTNNQISTPVGNATQRLFSPSSSPNASSKETMKKRNNIQLGLRQLLISRLDELPSFARTQYTVVCAWLCELWLHSICMLDSAMTTNSLDDGDDNEEDEITALRLEYLEQETEALHDFLDEYHDCLHAPTAIDLITSYGRNKELLIFANLIGDTGLVVSHHLHRQEYVEAIKALQTCKDKLKYAPKQPNGAPAVLSRADCELIYQTVPQLLPKEPAMTIDLLISCPGVDPTRLLGVLVRCGIHCGKSNVGSLHGQVSKNLSNLNIPNNSKLMNTISSAMGGVKRVGNNYLGDLTYPSADTVVTISSDADVYAHHVIKYLHHLIFKADCLLPSVHHLYVALLCKTRRCDELYAYICNAKFKDIYDPLFVLRLCKNEGKDLVRVAVQLYLDQHLYSDAIHLSLSADENLAHKVLIESSENLQDKPALLKKLWLSYAQVLIARGVEVSKILADVKSGSGKLSLVHLLECLPGITTVGDVRDEVLRELDGFSKEIDQLKKEMEALTHSNECIRNSITSLSQGAGSVLSNQLCDACRQPLLLSPFLYFNCTHAFHVTCAVSRAQAYLESNPSRKKTVLENILMEWQDTHSHSQSSSTNGVAKGSSNSNYNQTQTLKEIVLYDLTPQQIGFLIEEFAQSSCNLCGDMMIDSIDEPFINPHETDQISLWRM